MKLLPLLAALFVFGCVSHPDQVSIVHAVVRGYDETVTLGAPKTERTYVAELNIVAPSTLVGSVLSVSSKDPLPPDHLFHKTGAHVRLSIVSLERGRGTSLIPKERIPRIIYGVKIEDIRAIAEED